jgi:hypothetical protein
VIYVKKHLWRFAATVLAGERIALEDFKAQ